MRMEKRRRARALRLLVLCLDSAQLGEGKQQTLIFHCGYRILWILPHLRRRKAGRKGSQIPQEALSPFCGLFPWTAASSSVSEWPLRGSLRGSRL